MFDAKSSLVRGSQLKTQELSLSYKIVGDATPANAVVTIDDPSILFIETESTSATGSSDISGEISSGETYTPQAADDSLGQYSCMVRIDEKLGKVISVEARERKTGAVIPCLFTTAPSESIISRETAGDNDLIVFDVDHGADLTAATVEAVIVVKYSVE